MNRKHPDPLMITLPYEKDTHFHICQLLRHLIDVGRSYIVTGSQHDVLNRHTNPHSLDYWIRTNVARSKDTCNATKELIDQLIASGLFEHRDGLINPASGRKCKGIMLKDDAC